MSPASSILTGPGTLCTGQRATFTCNITDGVDLTWTYDADRLISIDPRLNSLPDPVTRISDNITFSVSRLMSTTTHLVSEISFTASARINNMMLICSGTNAEEESVILQVLTGEPSLKYARRELAASTMLYRCHVTVFSVATKIIEVPTSSPSYWDLHDHKFSLKLWLG